MIYEKVEFKVKDIKNDRDLLHTNKRNNWFNELLCAKNQII